MRVTTFVLLCATVFAPACGGMSDTVPSAPTPPLGPDPGPPAPSLTATVAITSTGFAPSEVTIAVGGRVMFVNSDSRPHDLLGGPDHTRLDCPEVDVVGFLVPGQSRETAVLTTARTCEFHDHINVGNPAFQGRIIVR